MDANEFKAIDQRLEAMSERCDRLISRNRPLTLDTPPRRKVMPRKAGQGSGLGTSGRLHAAPASPVIASGPLTGNEMRRPSGYSPQPREEQDCCDPDGMWERFEAEFDEMVQAHRA